MKIKTHNICILTLLILNISLTIQAQFAKKKLTTHNNKNSSAVNPASKEGISSSNSIEDHDTTAAKVINNPSKVVPCKMEEPICPSSATDNQEDLIEVNFENTDLQNLLKWISETFEVNFLSDDIFTPLPQGGKALEGSKITFQTHKPLTKKKVWILFLNFLDLFGLSLVKSSVPNVYLIRQTAPNANSSITRSPINAYINIDWKELPDSDEYIRYVYFARNSTLATLQPIIDAFRSTNATLKALPDLNAFVITDKANNMRVILQVIQELDRVSMPEALSVLKLKSADAEDVVKLYNNLTKAEDPRRMAVRLFGSKKLPTSVYFPENLRLIAERRNNLLIILGDAQGIKKVEEFIINHVDTELKTPYSPLYVYELQYTSAEDMANILTNVVKFAQGTPAAQSGGTREGDKYLQPMTIIAEPSGNRLLIKAEKEDYLKVRDVIKELDIKQPQIAIEVLIVNVVSRDDRELGVQIRNNDSSTINHNVDFQTSGFVQSGGSRASPIVNQDTGSLVTNLIRLAENQNPGATLLSISNAVNGVWAIFKILQTYVNTNLISNPFLVATNKYTSEVSIGETRRVLTGEVKGTRDASVLGDVTANLTLKITPQINKIGIINLDIDINIDTFSDATDPQNANRETKTIRTNANVGNKQVIALGGLLKDNYDENTTKVPLFGDIPVIGWLFKNKNKVKRKDNLLIFLSPRIVEPQLSGGIDNFTYDKADLAKKTLGLVKKPAERRDPIHRWFFKDHPHENTEYVDNFLAQKHEDVVVKVPSSLLCEPRCHEKSILADTSNKSNPSQDNKIIVAGKSNPKKNKRRDRSIIDNLMQNNISSGVHT